MTPETIIRDAVADGVSLALTPEGTIRLRGDKAAVAKWTPSIRDHKPALLETLKAANTPIDPDQERRRLAVLELLRRHPEITRACVVDGEADPVRVALAVRGVGTCELIIPADRWEPFRFMELLERHGGTA